MDDLEAELDRARALAVDELADAVESIGFECTRCGACCRGDDGEHTATVFPDEVRAIADGDEEAPAADGAGDRPAYDWRDVARPMPFGLDGGGAGDDQADGGVREGPPSGETFEWALQTDACGDCTFYEEVTEPADGGAGTTTPAVRGEATDGRRTGNGRATCTVYGDRPLICRTYPFSVDLAGTEPMGEVVDAAGPVRAHECEGLGRDIDREDAEALARALKERAVRDVEELIAVRDAYEPADPGPGEVVVHDSEGAKAPDGTPYR